MKHLDKVNEPYIQLQMTVIARKKKSKEKSSWKAAQNKRQMSILKTKNNAFAWHSWRKKSVLEESVQSIIIITTNRVD